MKIIVAALAALALAGCGGSLMLVNSGKAYPGKFDAVSKTIEVDVDGKLYKGNYVTNASFATASTNMGLKTATSTITSGGNTGSALLMGSDNSVIRCQFNYQGMSAVGVCQDSAGRMFDMVTK